jgi:hypothetical protein
MIKVVSMIVQTLLGTLLREHRAIDSSSNCVKQFVQCGAESEAVRGVADPLWRVRRQAHLNNIAAATNNTLYTS